MFVSPFKASRFLYFPDCHLVSFFELLSFVLPLACSHAFTPLHLVVDAFHYFEIRNVYNKKRGNQLTGTPLLYMIKRRMLTNTQHTPWFIRSIGTYESLFNDQWRCNCHVNQPIHAVWFHSSNDVAHDISSFWLLNLFLSYSGCHHFVNKYFSINEIF